MCKKEAVAVINKHEGRCIRNSLCYSCQDPTQDSSKWHTAESPYTAKASRLHTYSDSASFKAWVEPLNSNGAKSRSRTRAVCIMVCNEAAIAS
jgi:hypothetical protein